MQCYKYVVSSDEIFRFAEQTEGYDYHTCHEIFFQAEVLTIQGWNQYELAEIQHNDGAAWEVLTHFMRHENLDEMIVIND